jgi:hypothetical protein
MLFVLGERGIKIHTPSKQCGSLPQILFSLFTRAAAKPHQKTAISVGQLVFTFVHLRHRRGEMMFACSTLMWTEKKKKKKKPKEGTKVAGNCEGERINIAFISSSLRGGGKIHCHPHELCLFLPTNFARSNFNFYC